MVRVSRFIAIGVLGGAWGVAAAAHARGPAGGMGFHRSWGTTWNAPSSARLSVGPSTAVPVLRQSTAPPLILRYPPRSLVPMPELPDRYVPPVRYPPPFFSRGDQCGCE